MTEVQDVMVVDETHEEVVPESMTMSEFMKQLREDEKLREKLDEFKYKTDGTLYENLVNLFEYMKPFEKVGTKTPKQMRKRKLDRANRKANR